MASKEVAILHEKLKTQQEKASKDVAISAKEASDKLFMVFHAAEYQTSVENSCLNKSTKVSQD